MAVFNTNQVRHLYVTGVNENGGVQSPVAYGSSPDAATLKSAPIGI